MVLLQALIDSAISANWFFGAAISVFAWVMWHMISKYFKRIDQLLEKYGNDIAELKTGHEVQEHRIEDLTTRIDGGQIADQIVTKLRAMQGK